jgi:urease accessory protein
MLYFCLATAFVFEIEYETSSRHILPDKRGGDMSSVMHQRAQGTLLIEMKSRGGQTVLADLRQEGCLKARFPRPVEWPEGAFEAVLLNASGGIAGGDRLHTVLRLREAARGSFAAQAAERFYRVLPGGAPPRVRTELHLARGSAAEWLPQEAILFDRSALDRRLDVAMAGSAAFLGVEMLVFGRRAMGETVREATLADTITLRRDDKLIWHDSLRFTGDPHAVLARAAAGRGAGAVATLLYAAPDASARLETLREALAGFEAGVSALDGLLAARVVAEDGEGLRAAVLAGLSALRDGRALPRVWGC